MSVPALFSQIRVNGIHKIDLKSDFAHVLEYVLSGGAPFVAKTWEANGLKRLASSGHEGKLCWQTAEAWKAEKEIRFSHFVAAILGGKNAKTDLGQPAFTAPFGFGAKQKEAPKTSSESFQL
ncbi:hypothetical protein CDAR_385041 [Caerostris darwini]|uniref:Uncharacterized protein n=1 Tax=Caerostris darwini TaxID=1538125 RepID=A0AAV4WCB1_9ARAC|nr:hypothetical protein CDAR_385041 [Caerostris darwini]